MNDTQIAAFNQGSGLSVNWLHWIIELIVGGVAIAVAVGLIVYLIQMLDAKDLGEKARFKLYLFGICFFLTILLTIVLQ